MTQRNIRASYERDDEDRIIAVVTLDGEVVSRSAPFASMHDAYKAALHGIADVRASLGATFSLVPA